MVEDASSNRWSTLHHTIRTRNFSEEAGIHARDREAESCFSLSIANAWSSMKIFLSDVTAKFVCVSLSEELLPEGNSSIGGVKGLDEKSGEFD